MIRLLRSVHTPGCLLSERLCLSNSPLDAEATPTWPRYKQKMDKHAVLDALASTIQPITPPLMFGHGPTDPYFIHNSRTSLLRYAQHWLAGKRAANYVIDRNPDLFPGFRALPEVVPDAESSPTSEPSLERLEYLIRLGLAEESYCLYTLLKTEHSDVSIPVDLLDNLLELVAYKCVGGEYKMSEKKKTHKFVAKASEANSNQGLESAYFSGSSKRWKKDGPCDQLFQEMKELGVATADSYNSMLMGKYRYDTLTEFAKLYDEMLEQGLQPSLLVYNNYLRVVILHYTELGMEPHERLASVNRTIQRMNTEPVVVPDIDTFNTLTRFANFENKTPGTFPSAYQVFREMLSRHIKPNLCQLRIMLRCNSSYLGDLLGYVKDNRDILKFSMEVDQQNFLGSAMEAAIANKEDRHVEYIAQLNRETFGLLDSQEPGVLKYYVNYKFGFWNVLSEPERADEMCQVLREYIQMAGFPSVPEIESATKFFQIGRYDLFLKVMRDAFVVHNDSNRHVVADLLRIFNTFLSDHLLPHTPPNSELMMESTDFIWILLSRFERCKFARQSDGFFLLCKLALNLFESVDLLKHKRISKWLSENGQGDRRRDN